MFATDLTGTQTQSEGAWYGKMPLCTGSATPTGGRYGHTLSFDSLNRKLVMVGGYSASGAPYAETLTYYDGRTFTVPEVWTDERRLDPSPCYFWSKITIYGNSIDIAAQAPPFSGLSQASAVYVSSSGLNSGYYSMFDHSCEKAGPIFSSDPAVNKLGAGGVYFDIDRSVMGEQENILLTITFIPLGPNNLQSSAGIADALLGDDSALFRIHLVKTGSTGDDLRRVFQPRYLTYADTNAYPEVVKTLAILAPPTGEVRQEQILIPLAMDPNIDRIRIERYSGSAVLIDASLYRLGAR
jgi:hypothetical protein